MDELDDFYAVLRRGTTVAWFLEQRARLFVFIKARGLVADYRLAKGRLKRLRDEVDPVACFARQHAAPQDRIQFPLNDEAPDCNLRHGDTHHRTIDTTVVQGQERLHTMRELNETGTGRGYLGLTDDNPTNSFRGKMKRPRVAYTTEEAQETITRAVELCARKKKGHIGTDTLIIDAPLFTLPADRWREIVPGLAAKVADLAFREVFLVSTDSSKICHKLK